MTSHEDGAVDVVGLVEQDIPLPNGASFAGWVCDGTRTGLSHEIPTVLRDRRNSRVLVESSAFRIVLDPTRVDFDVSDVSVTLWIGAQDRSGAMSNAPARAAAREIAGRRGADWGWLHGRFALVHIDLRSHTVLLATDRFGVHPICHSRGIDKLAFSDRADAVPLDDAPQIDPQAIYNYVYFHVIPAPRTIFRDVFRLEPAQLVRFGPDGTSTEFWWSPRVAVDRVSSLGTLKASFRDLIRHAVERQTNCEHIGSYLSGGTDSSTVCGMLRDVTGRPPQTFSIGFDAAGYDEMAYARIAARRYGAVHHEYYVTPADLVRSIPAVAAHYDQPFGNSSALPAYYCAAQAKQAGIDKMLAGDGGDELFGGNSRYAKQKVFAVYDSLPAALRRRVIEPLLFGTPSLRRLPLLKKGVSYVEQARMGMPERTETYNLLTRFGGESVFTAAFLATIKTGEPIDLQRAVYSRFTAGSIVERMLAYDWRFTLADNDLPKVCGTARLAEIEVGFPFLDDDVLDFSLRLAPEMKVRGLTLRYFFKEALKGFLPDEIIRKRKHGFGLPFGPWLERSASLRSLAQTSLEQLSSRGIIKPDLVRELFSHRLHEHAGYFGEMIWVLMMLEHWLAAKAPAFAVD